MLVGILIDMSEERDYAPMPGSSCGDFDRGNYFSMASFFEATYEKHEGSEGYKVSKAIGNRNTEPLIGKVAGDNLMTIRCF